MRPHDERDEQIAELQSEVDTLRDENARLRAELAALTPPQPVADWRERCVVEKAEDGLWDIHNATRTHFMISNHWYSYENFKYPLGAKGIFNTKADATEALAACPTPPPGVGK